MARYLVSDVDAATALELAQEVERGTLKRNAAFDCLTSVHGFAPHTANAYLNCYAHLRKGTPWKATVSESALRAMLNVIALKGEKELFIALQSVRGHEAYFVARGNNMPRLRNLLREYQALMAGMTDMLGVPQALDDAVRRAGCDNPEKRRERIDRAPKKPAWVIRLVREFVRNPDVIVEVLNRAGGRCESCGALAPFNRRSDGSPYLEVHHKIRLADDGEDTVENAIALCPNCHRLSHYG
ncbi:HNH endonuclease [Metapseudomonas otitidis]